jgi:putative SOS response-associated peptidase YedK
MLGGMCTRYSLTKGQAAILALIKAMKDNTGRANLASTIYPDGIAPVVRQTDKGTELIKMRWGFPKPAIFKGGGYVVNVRNVKSGFWKPWLKPEQRCLVPVTSFCEFTDKLDPKTKRKTATWFALSEKRPIFFFAGIWREWTGTRGTKADPVTGDHLLYSFLTTDPNKDVKPVHSKAMPVILTEPEEWQTWLTAPTEKALKLHRPLENGLLKIVLTGEQKDAA